MKNIIYILVFLLGISQLALAAKIKQYDIKNGFYVEARELDFSKSIRGGICHGTVPYPYFTNEDEELFMEMNEEVHDFAEIYVICNEGERDNYSVSYEVPESKNKNFFSIIWTTKKEGKNWRIDTITFDRDQGDLIKLNQVFNILTASMLDELAKVSDGHIAVGSNWEEFQDRYRKRDYQLFIDDDIWYIVFNPTAENDKLVKAKIPTYFLKGDDVTNSR